MFPSLYYHLELDFMRLRNQVAKEQLLMKKKCVKPSTKQKDIKSLLESKARIASNTAALLKWSAYTQYVIIGEIMPKITDERLMDLLRTLHDATSRTVTELAKRTG